ncbi:MAG: homoserine kinase [Acidobacteria bacterium]|nr:homoserine kinase [Acidobacteriota bacterium]MBE3135485.1 homoserine kinase [Acidobacteriota bacterium]
MISSVRVFAPASVSNLGPGFDILGLAIEQPGDLVEAEFGDAPGIEIVEITGEGGVLPSDAARNVAGVAAADVLRRLREGAAGGLTAGTKPGVRIHLHKRMPLASGLGSSAASSVAAAVAVNELHGRPFTPRELLASAVEGERVASGSPHADNAAPCLLGGIILVRTYEPLDVLELPVPPDLWVVVVHPHCSIRTAEARALVFERRYSLAECVANMGNLGAFVGALYRGDLQLVGRSISDQLIEPIRARLIPGFFAVKEAALAAGALGCSISGSGPSVFALSDNGAAARRIAALMAGAFQTDGHVSSDSYVGRVNTEGAHVVD